MSKLAFSFLVISLVCVERAKAATENPSSALDDEGHISTEWNPMQLVAHFPMAVLVTSMPTVAPNLGITEAMLHDIVTARLRESDMSHHRLLTRLAAAPPARNPAGGGVPAPRPTLPPGRDICAEPGRVGPCDP